MKFSILFTFICFTLILYLNCGKIDIKSENKINDMEVIIDEGMRRNKTVELFNNTINEDTNNSSVAIDRKLCDFKKLKEKIKKSKRLVNIISSQFINENVNDTNNNRTFLRNNHTINNTLQNITINNSSFNYTIRNSSLSSNDTIILPSTNNTSNVSTSTNSITSDDLLSIIHDQTEYIKNEICSSCLEINSSLDILIEEIKKIKKVINIINSENSTNLSTRETFTKISNCINNLNLIKADLFKLNEILDTLQKANCSNFMENSKKYQLVLNSTNKISEAIQNVIRKLNININLVVLN